MVTATAVGVLAIALFGFFLITQLSRTRADSPDITRYTVGDAERLAELVDADGPLLFQDVSSGERDLFVQHLGDGGWKAFQAYVPGSDRSCQLEWQAADTEFLDPCSGETYPADGAGLPTWPAEVDEEGRLIIDLRIQSPAPG